MGIIAVDLGVSGLQQAENGFEFLLLNHGATELQLDAQSLSLIALIIRCVYGQGSVFCVGQGSGQ